MAMQAGALVALWNIRQSMRSFNTKFFKNFHDFDENL
jgi:hypothetical protein